MLADHFLFLLPQAGEHPFECEFCGCCYRDENSLRNHRQIHTGEKPFTCNGCGKRFSLKHQLETHYRVHTGTATSFSICCNLSRCSYPLLCSLELFSPSLIGFARYPLLSGFLSVCARACVRACVCVCLQREAPQHKPANRFR